MAYDAEGDMDAGPVGRAWTDAGYKWAIVPGLVAPAVLLPEDGAGPLACLPATGDREEHFAWCACELATQRAGAAGLTEGLMALSPRRAAAARGTIGLLRRLTFAAGGSLWDTVGHAALALLGGATWE